MKKIAKSFILRKTQVEHFAYQVQSILAINFDKPMTSKNDLLDRGVAYMTNAKLGENITKQTMSKAFYPRILLLRKIIWHD
jgi:hypothetical protein